MNQTTKTISLVLISSALVFMGWGCPMGHEQQAEKHHHNPASHRYGHSMFWYHPYGYYGGGYGGRAGPSGQPGGGPAAGRTGNVSSRGGFGSSGGMGGHGVS